MNAVVGVQPWPHVGREVNVGESVFALIPHVAADRSLAELEEQTGKSIRLQTESLYLQDQFDVVLM